MTVTHSGTGTPTSATGSASTLAAVYPATVNAGEKAVIHVNVKPFSATITTPTGFQLAPGATNPATNGSTASGTNTGSTKEAFYESILPCVGTEGGTTVNITVTSADSAGAVIHTAATDLGGWATSVYASGNKVGNSANMSAASGTQTSVAAGDLFYIGFAANASLGTPTTDTLTQTGVTFGTVTNRSDRAITTGNDTRNRVNSVPVTSVSTPSGGATAGYTNASSTSGTVGFLRLRDAATAVSITPNDAAHAHAAESPTITASYAVAPADGAHAHSAESPGITQVHMVAPADGAHAQAAESPALTQLHLVAPNDATHAQSAESPAVVVVVIYAVAPNDGSHGHTAESPAITQVHVVAPADGHHALSSESPVILLVTPAGLAPGRTARATPRNTVTPARAPNRTQAAPRRAVRAPARPARRTADAQSRSATHTARRARG